MTRKEPVLAALLLASLLSACGKDEPAPNPPATQAVTGSVVKGPVQGATVKIFRFDPGGVLTGPELASAVTDSSGRFTITAALPLEHLLTVACGGVYVDESDPAPPASRRRVALTASDCFESVLPAGEVSLAITPYSNALLLKARREAAGANFAVIFDAVRAQAIRAFGFDPFITVPADPTAPDPLASIASAQYAMLLGAASQVINAIAVNAGRYPVFADVMSFIQDLADNGRVDRAVLADEIRRFRNNNYDSYSSTPIAAVDENELSQPANVAPKAANDSFTTASNVTLSIAAPGVLANDTDLNGNPLAATLVSAPASGTLTLRADGSLTYAPASGFTGTVTFIYKVNDGLLDSNTATVTIGVAGAPAFVYFPYDIDSLDGGGAFAVKSSDFTQVLTVETPGTAQLPTSTFHTADFHVVLNADGTLASFWKDRMAYIKNGQLFYVGLRDTDSPAVPTRFSSEAAAASVCRTDLATLSPGGGRDAWFFYKLPGANSVCDDDPTGGDDVVKAARLSFGTAGGPGSDPITIPGRRIPNAEFNATAGSADSQGFLLVDNGALKFYDANFANPQTLIATGVTGINEDNPGRVNQSLVEIFGPSTHELRIVSVSNGVASISGVLYTFRPGFQFQHGEADPGFYYFAEQPPCCPTAGTSRILKVSADGSTPAVVVHETASGSAIFQVSVTANKIVFVESPSTGSPALKMLDKTATAPSTPVVVTSNVAAGFLETSSSGIAYAEVTPGAPNTYRAFVKNEANAVTFDGLANSVWAGGAVDIVGTLSSGFTDRLSHGLVVQGVTDFDSTGVLGGTLKAVDASTGTLGAAIHSFTNATTENRQTFIFIERKGPGGGTAGLGGLCATSGECDIIAVDIGATTRYARITTTAVREHPVEEGGGQQGGGGPPVNQAPTALSDSYPATEDTPLTITASGVLGNDTDPESNPLTAVLDSPPLAGQGSVTLNADGSFTFTPAPNFFGTASFTYHANDGQANSSIATVTINVAAVNNDPPVANNDSYMTPVNTTLNVATPGVLGNDTDPDGTTPTANAVASGSTAQLGTFALNADGSFTYTPPSSTFTGADSFTYTATDGANSSNVATVSITVAANAGPTISNIPDQTTNEDTSTPAVPFTVGDAETPAASLTVIGSSSDITLVTDANIVFGGTGADRTVTVTPVANKSGTVTITVTVTDSGGLSTSDLFFLTIIAVADPPVANNDAYSTPVNTTLTITAPGVLSNDSDPDGAAPAAITGSGTTPPGGSFTVNADGSFTYNPPATFTGTDSFTYTATDGALTASATVSITVTGGPAFTYLPYFVDTAQGGGEFVVKSTDFTPPPITVVPTGSATPTSIDRVTSTGVVLNADSSINTIFQDRLVFIESGQLWYSGLRDSDAPTTLTRFSSETAATASCGVNVEEMDFNSSSDAWFFYRLPGADQTCFSTDDVTKAAKLSFGTAGGLGSDPITLPPGSNEFPTRFFAPTDLRTLGFLVVDAGKLDFYDANLQFAQNLIAGGVTSASRLRGDFNKALVVVNNTDGRIVSVSDATPPVPAMTAVVYTVQSGFTNNCGANEDATHYYVCEGRFTPSPAGSIRSIPKSATDTSGTLPVHDNTINNVFLQGLTDNSVVWQSANELLMLNKSGGPVQTLTTSIAPGPVLLGATRIFFTESAGANVYAAVGKDEANAQIFSGGTASAWVGLGAQIVGQTTSGFVTDRAVRGLLVQGFSNFDTTGVFGSTLSSVDLTAPTVSVPAASITTFNGSATDNRDLFIFVNAPAFTGLGALCEKSPGTDCDIVAIDASATPRYQRVTTNTTTSENPTSE